MLIAVGVTVGLGLVYLQERLQFFHIFFEIGCYVINAAGTKNMTPYASYLQRGYIFSNFGAISGNVEHSMWYKCGEEDPSV